MPSIEHIVDLPASNSGYFYRQDTDSNLVLYTIQEGKVHQFLVETNNGTYTDTEYEELPIETFQYDVNFITGDLLDDYSLILFGNSAAVSVAMYPQNTDKFKYDDNYRLYWGYDSQKLYMNICNSWEMIGTLKHQLLTGTGKLTHEEIDTTIVELKKNITEMQLQLDKILQNEFTLNGLSGAANIIAGDNVSISTHTGTKQISIAAGSAYADAQAGGYTKDRDIFNTDLASIEGLADTLKDIVG